MTRIFIKAPVVPLAKALLTHASGEIFRIIVQHFSPDASRPACVAIGLVLSVILLEIAVMVWARR
jgi:hypothetical protein